MIVIYTFYKNINFTLSDHYIIDDFADYLKDVEKITVSDTKSHGFLLGVINITFEGKTAKDFNTIKPFNYLKVVYDFNSEKITHYYFINNVTTSHSNIFTFSVSIDLLNTYGHSLIFSPETFIERQHEKLFLSKYEYNGDYYFLRNIPKLVSFDFDIPELITYNEDTYYLSPNNNTIYKNFWLKVIYSSTVYGLVCAFLPYDGPGFRVSDVFINSFLNLRQNQNVGDIFTDVNVWSITVIPYCPIKRFSDYNTDENVKVYDLGGEPYFFTIAINSFNFLAIKVFDCMEYYNNSFLPISKQGVPLDFLSQFGAVYSVTDFIKSVFIEKINKNEYDACYDDLIKRNIKEPVLFSSAFCRFVISNNDFNFEITADDFETFVPLEDIVMNTNQKAIKIDFLPYFSEEKSIGFLKVYSGDFWRVKTNYAFNVPVVYELSLFNDKYRNYIDSGNFYVDKEILSNNMKQITNNKQLFETAEKFNTARNWGNLVTGALTLGFSSPFGNSMRLRGLNRAFGAGLELLENHLTYDTRKEKFNIETINLELQNRQKLNNYTFNRLSNKTVGNFELSYRRFEDFCFMFSAKKLHDKDLAQRVADVYYFYGSNVNKYGVPYHNARIRFDYLRCRAKFVNINMVINLGCLKLLEEFYAQGVTYIHKYKGKWVFPFQQVENCDS